MLRRALLVWGIIDLSAAAILFAVLTGWPRFLVAGYLVINGVILIAGLLFERHRYKPPVDRATGDWQPTGERFIDPASGQVLEVRYNAKTGERDYVPVKEGDRG
jgi:hypothetical protein